MKRIFLIIFALLCTGAFAQRQTNVTYTGTVVDEDDRQPLAGVSMLISGTSTGTMTDAKGNFTISAPKDATFLVSFIGYESRQVKLATGSSVTVMLKSSATDIEDVIVIGYGTVRRSEATVSSSGIRATDMKTEGVTSFEQSLQGKLSGVVVINTEGSPGAAMSMEIRGVSSITGSNEPLYVIDGMPVESDADMLATQAGGFTTNLNPMASINPNDIQSIEILKDAAATAIYGSRGANGVIMITTKSGQAGQARVTASSTIGVSNVTRKIHLLSPKDYGEYIVWAATQRQQYINRYAEEYAATGGMPTSANETYWQDLIFRQARTQEYAVNVTGGQKNFNYMVSGNYYDQKGVVLNSDFKRMSFRANLNMEMRPWAKLSSKTNISRNVYNTTGTSLNLSDATNQGVIKMALRLDPTVSMRGILGDEFGDELDEDEESSGRRNPYLEAIRPTHLTAINRLTQNLVFDFTISKNLTYRPSFGIDYSISRSDTYYPEDTYTGRSSDPNEVRLGSIQYAETQKWITEHQFNYQYVFDRKHVFSVMGVYSMEQVVKPSLRATARGFANNDLENQVLQNGSSSTYRVPSSKIKTGLMSFSGRLNYNYDKRYLVTATIRADGSSRFGANNKWAYFPSVAFAWNAINEKSLQRALNSAQISNLRARLSWGLVGNQAIPPYRSTRSFSFGKYPSGALKKFERSLVQDWLDNSDLKWETTEQYNLGIDYGMFNERLKIAFNAYYKVTRDLLQNVVVPASIGFNRQYQNSGEIENRGVELEVTGVPVQGKKFNWRVMANISTNRNKILSLGNGNTFQAMEDLGTSGSMTYSPFVQKVGQPLGMLWGYKTDGVYQTVQEYANIQSSIYHAVTLTDSEEERKQKMLGEIRVVDTNGDGHINDDDRVAIGDVNPKFTFGITNFFTYGRFDLSILFMGRVGGHIYSQVFSEIEHMQGIYNMTPVAYNGRWQGEGTSNYYPKLHKQSENTIQYVALDRFVESATYLRIKNVKLSFNFDSNAVKIPGFPKGSLYFSVDNLHSWFDYRGYDPEISSFGQNAAKRGVDMGGYPMSRTFSFGITLNL